MEINFMSDDGIAVASMTVSLEKNDNGQKFVRITNNMDDTYVNLDPMIDATDIMDAVVDIA